MTTKIPPAPAVPAGPPAPHITAGVVVLLVGLLATVWLTDWPLAAKVLLSTPLAAFAVAFAGQFARTYAAGRRDPRA